jgi:arsenate reductase
MKMYHNPKCSKSLKTLEIIIEKNKEVEIIEYLKNPPSKDELKEILKKLNMCPEEIVRKAEPIFKEKFKEKKFSKNEWINLLIEYPILMQRPIIVNRFLAVIGRPPENVLKLF